MIPVYRKLVKNCQREFAERSLLFTKKAGKSLFVLLPCKIILKLAISTTYNDEHD